jgi:phosphoglycerol transferase MdoB-like AlkP superfamily enzyme
MLIIYATLSISALFRRRTFVITIISSIWAALGIANGIILTQRMTPFNMKDLTALGDGITLMTTYFSVFQIVGLVAGIIALVGVFVLLFFKGKKRDRIHPFASLLGVLLSWGVTLLVTMGLINAGVLSTFFGSLPYAYRDYGVPYCFTNTWLNTGIHKPANYSAAMMKKIIKDNDISQTGKVELKNKDIATDDDDMPNILFLQLESFVDPLKFKHIALSEDPIPYYRSLMKNYSSGSLTVPACGAGTANTEFEVLTGISAKFFGPGEYPYKGKLRKETLENMAYVTKSHGYETSALCALRLYGSQRGRGGRLRYGKRDPGAFRGLRDPGRHGKPDRHSNRQKAFAGMYPA